MAQFFQIHPTHPQLRLIHRVVDIVRQGGIIIYPTDSSYAFGCHIGDKQALDRIRRIRQLSDKHEFTLVCDEMTQVSSFAKVSNEAFRMIKTLSPGPYTYLLKATREVPRRLQHPKKKTIGIRIPDHPVTQVLLQELGEPMLSSTLLLPDCQDQLSDPNEIRERLEHHVDLVIDAGLITTELTTIIGLDDDSPRIIRQGKGDVKML